MQARALRGARRGTAMRARGVRVVEGSVVERVGGLPVDQDPRVLATMQGLDKVGAQRMERLEGLGDEPVYHTHTPGWVDARVRRECGGSVHVTYMWHRVSLRVQCVGSA